MEKQAKYCARVRNMVVLFVVVLFAFTIQSANAQTVPVTQYLMLHLDAATLELNDNDPVAEWLDISGEDNHATQETVSLQPVFKIHEVDEKPVVRFDGSSSLRAGRVLNGLTIGDDFTIFLVFYSEYDKASAIISSQNDDFANARGIIVGWSREMNVFRISDGSNRMQVNGTNAFTGDRRIITAQYDGSGNAAGMSLYIDGQEETVIEWDQGPTIMDNEAYTYIGARNGEDIPVEGDIAEILIYYRKLSSEDKAKVEDYLARKYDLLTLTWSGEIDNEWGDVGNWEEDIDEVYPSAAQVTIPGGLSNYPIITDMVTIGSLIIESGASLTIAETGRLIVSGILTNTNTDGIIIESTTEGTGCLIQYSEEVSATMQQYIPASTGVWPDKKNIVPDDWYWISSPVSGQNINNLLAPLGGSNYDLYRWEEANDTWLNYHGGTYTVFERGEGYLFAATSTATFEYKGELHVGEQTWTNLSHAGSGDYVSPDYPDYEYHAGWHLLGNPYSSRIEVNEDWVIDGFAATPKLWKHGGWIDLGILYEETSFIPPMTAFFMQVNDGNHGNNILTIPVSARFCEPPEPDKKDKVTENLIRLVAKAEGSNMLQESLIRVEPETAEGFDPRFDSRFMPGNAPIFFSLTETDLLSTQAINEINQNLSIPFVFIKNQEGNNFQISAERVIPDINLYLFDNILNLEHKLVPNSPYTFTSFEGDDPERFELRFGSQADPTGIFESEAVSVGNAWFYDNMLYVNSLEENTMVGLFDISGRKLRTFRQGTGQQAYPLNLPAGLYIVRMSGQNTIQSIKIVVQ